MPAESDADDEKKLCGACFQHLPSGLFSKKQWKLKQFRRCKRCADSGNEIDVERVKWGPWDGDGGPQPGGGGTLTSSSEEEGEIDVEKLRWDQWGPPRDGDGGPQPGGGGRARFIDDSSSGEEDEIDVENSSPFDFDSAPSGPHAFEGGGGSDAHGATTGGRGEPGPARGTAMCGICVNTLDQPSRAYETNQDDENGLSVAHGVCGHAFHLDCVQQFLSKMDYVCPHGCKWDFGKIERIREYPLVTPVRRQEPIPYVELKDGSEITVQLGLGFALGGKCIAVNVNASSTVCDVKALICSKEGIPTTQQGLVFAGEQLEDERILTEYRIGEGAKLHVMRCLGPVKPGSKIYIKTPVGKVITVDVDDPSITIGEVKSAISDQEGVHPDNQRLVYGGEQREDSATLDSCKIQDGSTLHLASRRFENITVKTSTGKVISLQSELGPYDSADALRDLIEIKEGIHYCCLLYDGRKLENGCLQEYKIHDGSIIHCGVFRGRRQQPTAKLKEETITSPDL